MHHKQGSQDLCLYEMKKNFTRSIEVTVGSRWNITNMVYNKLLYIMERLIRQIEKPTTEINYINNPLAMYLPEKVSSSLGTLKQNKRKILVKSKLNQISLFGFQDYYTLISTVTNTHIQIK